MKPDRDKLATIPNRVARAQSAAARRRLVRQGTATHSSSSAWREFDSGIWGPGIRLHRYELRERIGGGGMGVVWSARDIDLGRDVALKLIRSRDPSLQRQRARLLAEARAMARLSHPNVITVHDVGTADEHLFIAMERVDGGTLGEWFCSARRSWPEVVDVFVGAGRGLAAAHRAGLVHRDFKPDNVLLGRDGVPRVSDFGLALPVSEGDGAGGGGHAEPATDEVVVGTLAYMSPEQLRGLAVTARSDQFSFCVALHEALYGEMPFGAPSSEAPASKFLEAVLSGSLVTPPAHRRVPARLHHVVARGLAVEPAERWPSMDELVLQLELCAQGVARRPWAAVAGVAAVTALAAGLAGAWLWSRSPSPPREALAAGAEAPPGPSLRRLTAFPGDKLLEVALSPDGEHLAYSTDGKLHSMALDSGESHEIAMPAPLRAPEVIGWYPDGSKLLVLHRTEATPDGSSEVWSVSLRRAATASLLRGDVYCAAVAPDGKTTAYCTRGGVIVDDRGGASRRMEVAGVPMRLAWSPDGSHLAVFAYSVGRGWTLSSLDAGGGEAQVLVRDEPRLGPHGPSGVAWVAGRRIVYAIADGNRTVLWARRIEPSTGKAGPPVKLSELDGALVTGLSATRDGSRLAFARVETQIDVRALSIGHAGTEPLRLTLDDRVDTLVGWSADSRAVYIQSARGTGTHVYRHRLSLGEPTFVRSGLPDSTSPWARRAALTPDRSAIVELAPVVGSADDEPRLGLFVSPLSGGESRRIGWFDFSARDRPSVRCAMTCVIARMSGGGELLFHDLDLELGLGREIARIDASFAPGSATGWDLCDDSSMLAVAVAKQIHVIDRLSGSVRTVVPDHDAYYQEVAWGADTVYATSMVLPSISQLVRIESSGRTEVLHTDASGSVSWFAPMVAPDQSHVAFDSRTFDADAWMLEGL